MEIKALVIDLNGTLFDPIPATLGVFKDLGIDPNLIQLWFTEVLRDAFAAQLAGVFAPFKDYAGHHLARRTHSADTTTAVTAEEAGTKLAQAWSSSAQPYPDIATGITELQMAGLKIAILTNGSVQIATAVLKKAGLLSHSNTQNQAFSAESAEDTPIKNSLSTNSIAVFDINETLAWKPAKEAYHFVCNALALPPSQVLLCASHPWDCHGALQAGLKAAYIQREPNDPYPKFLDPPQIVVKDFTVLADTLLNL